jgi:hypothetical protein
MSKTVGHRKSQRVRSFGQRKLKPYVKDEERGGGGARTKHTVTCGRGLGISKTGKLVAKNANRSMRKGVRQEAKQTIKKELE